LFAGCLQLAETIWQVTATAAPPVPAPPKWPCQHPLRWWCASLGVGFLQCLRAANLPDGVTGAARLLGHAVLSNDLAAGSLQGDLAMHR
jgi:hypothetical protein